jgi:hypothetical protein
MSIIQDLLKKINYIEADIEIQKQILFSIPSEKQAEMEKIVAIIAAKKTEIETLRMQIKGIDPEEFARILMFEKAIDEFKKLAATRQFTSITGRNITEECVLTLRERKSVECLVKACDADGNWTIIDIEGKIQNFSKDTVAEEPAKSPLH